MEENKRLLAVFVLGLATLFTVLVALEDTDPFPINPAAARQLVYYRRNTDGDTSNHTVTDPDTLRTFMDELNRAEKREAEHRDLLEADWQVMIFKPDGRAFSLTIWEEGTMELRADGTWRYEMDCGPLCELLEEDWA